MITPEPRFVGLSCYISNLAGYLGTEFADIEEHLAESMRLAVRTDLPDGQLAFSHHRYPLNRMPDGTWLGYATAACPSEAAVGVSEEMGRHDRVLVVTDNAKLPWSPCYHTSDAAPHWLLIDERRGESWHAVDTFSGLLPSGEQRPYAGWLSTAELFHAMTPPAKWTPEQEVRNELAFGFPLPPPSPGGWQWLRREVDSRGQEELPGTWLVADDAVLPFLGEYVAEQGARAERHLDDLWTAALHRAFRHRVRGHVEAASAWAQLPGALRFAVDSARRGRPRDSLVRKTVSHLLRLELDLSTAPSLEGSTMKSRTLYDWFRASAQAYPDHVALELSSDAVTYAELSAAVEQMCAAMYETLGGSPRRVGLLTSRSLIGYVAYLATQRLGATAVPLNPANPAARNLAITSEAGLDITMIDDTSGEGLTEYQQKADVRMLDMTGSRWHEIFHPNKDVTVPAVVERGADDFAYIIFTSGTTGKPKGVPTTHANVTSFLTEVIKRYRFEPESRVSQTFEMCFDGSILAMFGAWGSGATLCVAQRSDVLTPVRFINAKRLTHWLSVPSLISFAKRLRALAPNSMPTLRLSSFGGEPLTIEQVDAWTTAAPNTAVINCYGPTETTVIVTAYEVPANPKARVETWNRSVPIGDIYTHLDYLLLDTDLRQSDDGELCIRGAQRFPGYLDPAENVGRFVSFDGERGHPYDGREPLTAEQWYRTGDRIRRECGELVHMGRIDHQIKVRGNRVELGEIEATLRKHPAIVEAVVIATTADDGEIDLHALYTGGQVADEEFARLMEDLPAYMRPRGFHHRKEIPLTEVDKLDRKRLAEEFVSTVR